MVGDDEVRVLPESHQLHRLCAVFLVEHHRVGHQIGHVLVGGVDVDLHEDEEAVVRGDLHIAELRARHAIHVDAVVGLLAARQHDIDLHRRPCRVAHREGARARRDGGEHCVEHHRVGRELEIPLGVVVAVTGGKGERQGHDNRHGINRINYMLHTHTIHRFMVS